MNKPLLGAPRIPLGPSPAQPITTSTAAVLNPAPAPVAAPTIKAPTKLPVMAPRGPAPVLNMIAQQAASVATAASVSVAAQAAQQISAVDPTLPTQPVPLEPIDQLRQKIRDFDVALVQTFPQHKVLLSSIHKMIGADESLTYLLAPEEVGKVVAGLIKLADVQIAAEAAKKTTKKSAKALSSISVDDI